MKHKNIIRLHLNAKHCTAWGHMSGAEALVHPKSLEAPRCEARSLPVTLQAFFNSFSCPPTEPTLKDSAMSLPPASCIQLPHVTQKLCCRKPGLHWAWGGSTSPPHQAPESSCPDIKLELPPVDMAFLTPQKLPPHWLWKIRKVMLWTINRPRLRHRFNLYLCPSTFLFLLSQSLIYSILSCLPHLRSGFAFRRVPSCEHSLRTCRAASASARGDTSRNWIAPTESFSRRLVRWIRPQSGRSCQCCQRTPFSDAPVWFLKSMYLYIRMVPISSKLYEYEHIYICIIHYININGWSMLIIIHTLW